MRLDNNFVKHVIPEAIFLHKNELPQEPIFSIDTRTLNPGEIFVALEGLRVDGHEFLAQTLSKGAAGIIIAADKKNLLNNLNQDALKKITVIVVPSPRTALIELAKAWRAQFDITVIGITGSIGKTSTKYALQNILAHYNAYPFLVSSGNQNTALGISLNLLRLKPEHKVALIEMGINKRGEMAKLVDIVRPDMAVITTLGHSHMEGLGSIADIAAEKREIFKLFKEDSIGIINGDQPFLANVAYPHPVIKFGSKTTNQVQARKIMIAADRAHFILKLYGEKYVIDLKTNHRGAIFNALAAAAVAYLLKIPSKTIIEGIAMPVEVSGRFEKRVLKLGKGFLINDCYNASPESMKAALLALQSMQTKAHKIAVLGDMLELGVNSPFWHRQLGRFLRKVPSLKQVILVGSMVQWTKKTLPLGVKVDIVPTWQDAVPFLQEKLAQESIVLIKGSRDIGLNNLVQVFT